MSAAAHSHDHASCLGSSLRLSVWTAAQYGALCRLEELLGAPGPFWGRHYTFFHQRKPLCVIFEAMSPRLFAAAQGLPLRCQ